MATKYLDIPSTFYIILDKFNIYCVIFIIFMYETIIYF